MPESPNLARINADLDRAFYREVKKFAIENDMSIRQLLIKALTQYMGKKR